MAYRPLPEGLKRKGVVPDRQVYAIPPPPAPKPGKPKPKSGGSGSRGGSRGGSSGGSGRRTSGSGGSGRYPGVKVFGQPITRADFMRAKQHYDDLFRAYVGRAASQKEIERILNSGMSDYALRISLMKKQNFVRSPMFKTLKAQVQGMLGFDYGNNKNLRNILINAARSEGGLSEASLRASIINSPVATRALTTSFRQTSGADVDYLAGSFGPGQLTPAQYRALALQQSGLQQSTLGARLQSQLDQAQKRMARVFEGTLASPNLSLGPAGLQAPGLQARQDADLPA